MYHHNQSRFNHNLSHLLCIFIVLEDDHKHNITTMKFDSETQKYGTCRSRPMDWQDVVDCISSMIQTENHYLWYDYLNLKLSQRELMPSDICMDDIECVDETCRSKMCAWTFNIIDATKLRRETASVAMSYLDRFGCSQSSRAMMARSSRKQYQLAAMTCLYIAGMYVAF